MNRTIARLLVIPLLSINVFFSMGLNAQTKKEEPPILTSIVITTDPKSPSPVTCLQLLLDETVTVYAVGVDNKGKVFPLSNDSVVSWSGGDALEIKSTGDQSATVKLAKPLKAAEATLSNHLSYDGGSFGSSVQITQKIKEVPKLFSLVFLKDPTRDKTIDIEKMKVGESITVFLRGMSVDMPTIGEVFTLPSDVNIGWSTVPRPPMGAEIKITPIGCHAAKIDLVKLGQIEGVANAIKVEASFQDGTKKTAAFIIEVTK